MSELRETRTSLTRRRERRKKGEMQNPLSKRLGQLVLSGELLTAIIEIIGFTGITFCTSLLEIQIILSSESESNPKSRVRHLNLPTFWFHIQGSRKRSQRKKRCVNILSILGFNTFAELSSRSGFMLESIKHMCKLGDSRGKPKRPGMCEN